MTPKVRKFRLAPGASLLSGTGPSPAQSAPAMSQTLTAQQLRQARRNAQRHNISATDDMDAIAQMQARGINPFAGPEILDGDALAPPDGLPAPAPMPAAPKPTNIGQIKRETDSSGLPQNMVPDDPLVKAAIARQEELAKMRGQIAKRRRSKLILLFARLAFFVALPTACVAWYFFAVATPMYSSEAEFLIEQPGGSAAQSSASLFSSGATGALQDSVTVQAWLTSRAAMQLLNEEHDYRGHFSQDTIDPLQRISPDALEEDVFKHYQKHVKVGLDTTDGIIKMEVIAADPQVALTFSKALLGYAENQIDMLTLRLREDQMLGAEENFTKAEARRTASLNELLDIQVRAQQIDPEGETSARTQQLSSLESDRQRLELELRARSAVARPNEAQLNDMRQRIANIDALMAELRSQMTQANESGRGSLATINTELRIAEENYSFQTALVQKALEHLEATRIEAFRQARYVKVGVEPALTDKPAYPRAFENTLLALMIFAGAYLMLSITAAILREQVSS